MLPPQTPEDLQRLSQLRSDTEGRARANQAALGAALGAQASGAACCGPADASAVILQFFVEIA
jgi:hypothetical protein